MIWNVTCDITRYIPHRMWHVSLHFSCVMTCDMTCDICHMMGDLTCNIWCNMWHVQSDMWHMMFDLTWNDSFLLQKMVSLCPCSASRSCFNVIMFNYYFSCKASHWYVKCLMDSLNNIQTLNDFFLCVLLCPMTVVMKMMVIMMMIMNMIMIKMVMIVMMVMVVMMVVVACFYIHFFSS